MATAHYFPKTGMAMAEHDFPKLVASLAGGASLAACCQCGACSAVCPVAGPRDTVRQVIQGVRSGLRSWVLKSELPRVCTVCGYCTTVCPQGIEVSEVIYALKRVVLSSRPAGTSLFRDCFTHLAAALLPEAIQEQGLAMVLDREPLALLAFGPMALAMLGDGRTELPGENRKALVEVQRLYQAAMEMEAP